MMMEHGSATEHFQTDDQTTGSEEDAFRDRRTAGSLPTLFISHGAPSLAIDVTPAHSFLAGLGEEIGRPRAIIVFSAHYESPEPIITSTQTNTTYHDFRGFSDALRAMRYNAPGDPALAEEIATLLRTAGFKPSLEASRGLDHGVWVPLSLMYPRADIPVLQISINPNASEADTAALGAAIAELRTQNVLIIGSGALTHNLGEVDRGPHGLTAPAPDWVKAFGHWAHDALIADDALALYGWKEHAPHGARNHPTVEHFLPLFAAIGAATGRTDRIGAVQRIHHSYEYAALAMDCFRFDG